MRPFILLFCLGVIANACNSNTSEEKSLIMTDALGQIFWTSSELEPVENGFGKYGGHHLFDKDTKTAWAEGKDDDGVGERIRFVSKEKIQKLEFINGYAKNEQIFHNNNRIKDFELSIYQVQFPQEGMVAEQGIPIKFKSKIFSKKYQLQDSFKPQSISIQSYWEKKQTKGPYAIELKILSVYKGHKFNDTCLTEIKTIFDKKKKKAILEVRGNDSELWLEDKLLLKNNNVVFQIMEVDRNNQWAILIEMPKDNEGRVETTYRLFNIKTEKIIPRKAYGEDIFELYRFEMKNGKNYLTGFDSKKKSETLIDLSLLRSK